MNSPRALLLVEDNPDDAFFFKRQVDAIGGFEIYLVSSVKGAIRFLQSARDAGSLPRAVFVDWRLPDLNGIELLDWLGHQPEFAAIPRYVLTAFASDEIELEARACGARQFWNKPVSASTLALVLAQA